MPLYTLYLGMNGGEDVIRGFRSDEQLSEGKVIEVPGKGSWVVRRLLPGNGAVAGHAFCERAVSADEA